MLGLEVSLHRVIFKESNGCVYSYVVVMKFANSANALSARVTMFRLHVYLK